MSQPRESVLPPLSLKQRRSNKVPSPKLFPKLCENPGLPELLPRNTEKKKLTTNDYCEVHGLFRSDGKKSQSNSSNPSPVSPVDIKS